MIGKLLIGAQCLLYQLIAYLFFGLYLFIDKRQPMCWSVFGEPMKTIAIILGFVAIWIALTIGVGMLLIYLMAIPVY